MMAPRFSIARLMAVISLCAVGLAALLHASELWASLVLTITLATLAIALLGAIFRRGRRQAFWGGFALVGWGYLSLCFGPWFASEVSPRLATTKLISAVYPYVNPQQRERAYDSLVVEFLWQARLNPPSSSSLRSQQGAASTIWYSLLGLAAPEHFQRVGHCLLALGFGYLGALMARYFHDTRDGPGASAH